MCLLFLIVLIRDEGIDLVDRRREGAELDALRVLDELGI